MNTIKFLYETDFDLWLKETVNLLRKGEIEKLDIENLAEEIELFRRVYTICHIQSWQAALIWSSLLK